MILYLFTGFQQCGIRFIRNPDTSFRQQCRDGKIVAISLHIKGCSQRFYLQIIATDDKALVFVLCHLKIGFSV